MNKALQVALALLGPCLDLVGAFLLSVYIVAGSEKMEEMLESLKKFSYDVLVGASHLVYRDTKSMDMFLEAPASKTPGLAAIHWLLYPFFVSALIVTSLLFLPTIAAATTYSMLLFIMALLFSLKTLRTRAQFALSALFVLSLFTALFYFLPLKTAVGILFVPVFVLAVAAYVLSIPLGFVFLVRYVVEKEQQKRVSLLGLLLLVSGFVVQGVYNVTSLC